MATLTDQERQLDRNLMTAIWQRIAREAPLSDPPPEKPHPQDIDDHPFGVSHEPRRVRFA